MTIQIALGCAAGVGVFGFACYMIGIWQGIAIAQKEEQRARGLLNVDGMSTPGRGR